MFGSSHVSVPTFMSGSVDSCLEKLTLFLRRWKLMFSSLICFLGNIFVLASLGVDVMIGISVLNDDVLKDGMDESDILSSNNGLVDI